MKLTTTTVHELEFMLWLLELVKDEFGMTNEQVVNWYLRRDDE